MMAAYRSASRPGVRGAPSSRAPPRGGGLSSVSLAVLVVGLAVGGAVVVPGHATAAGNSSATATFVGGDRTDQRGDVVEIPITVQGTDTATLTVGSRDVNYRTNVTVRDGNGDGRVDLAYNTYTAGSAGLAGTTVYTTTPGDAVVTIEPDADTLAGVDPPRSDILAADNYPLRVAAGATAAPATGESPDDQATLVLEAARPDGLSTWTAPAANRSTLQDPAAVERLRDAGTLRQTATVTGGDLVVFDLSARGLGGILAAEQADGGAVNVTDAFLNRTASHAGAATPASSDPDANAEWDLRIERVEGGGSLPVDHGSLDVVADAENDTYTLVYDTSATAAPSESQRYETTVTLLDRHDLVDGEQSVDATWTLGPPQATLATGDDDDLELSAASEQTIAGTTNVTPGSTVTVRVRGTDPGSRFTERLSATVDADGSFGATGNFSDREPGTNYTVDVRRQGATISESVDGSFDDAAAFDVTATTPNRDTATTGETVTVSYTVENTGRTAGEKRVEFRVNGSVVNERTIALEPGERATDTFVADSGGKFPAMVVTVATAEDSETATVDLETGAPATVSVTGVENALARLPGDGTGPIHTAVYRVTVSDGFGNRIRDGTLAFEAAPDASDATLIEAGTNVTAGGRATLRTADAFTDAGGRSLGDPATDLDGTVVYDAGEDATRPGTFYVFARGQSAGDLSLTIDPTGSDDGIAADAGTVTLYLAVDDFAIEFVRSPAAVGTAVNATVTPETAGGTRIRVPHLSVSLTVGNGSVASVSGTGTAQTNASGQARFILDAATTGRTAVEATASGGRGEATLRVVPPQATVRTSLGDSADLRAAAGQRLFGDTNLPRGTNVTVRVRGTGNSSFVRIGETTVDETGSYVATVSLADVEPGSNYSVLVRLEDEHISPSVAGTVRPALRGDDRSRGGGLASDAAFVSASQNSPLGILAASSGASRVEPGESTSIAVTLRNRGPVRETRRLVLRANGDAVATKTVTIRPERERTVSLAFGLDSPGVYELAVNGTDAGTVTVRESTETATTTETAGGGTETVGTDDSPATATTGSTGDLGVAAGGGLAIIALCALAVLGARRRKRS